VHPKGKLNRPFCGKHVADDCLLDDLSGQGGPRISLIKVGHLYQSRSGNTFLLPVTTSGYRAEVRLKEGPDATGWFGEYLRHHTNVIGVQRAINIVPVMVIGLSYIYAWFDFMDANSGSNEALFESD
jgi:hypothetical protein